MTVPAPLAEIIDDFGELSEPDRVTLLLEFADDLPALPSELTDAAMEPVPECQSPVFVSVDAADPAEVRLYFSAPREAPTTRGFASILAHGLDRQTAAEILGVPGDFSHDLGLAAVISPLRLRGMSGMLARVQGQIRRQTGIGTSPGR